MARRKCTHYSGIGGQAVLEGVMMKNKEKYAVAVRKPNGEIEVNLEHFKGAMHGSRFRELPFIRGVFNFVESMILGTKVLNYSASFYEDEDEKEKDRELEEKADRVSGGNGEKLMTVLVTILSIALAVGFFIVLPYFLSALLDDYVRNRSLLAILEGVIRIVIFLLYVWGISFMSDIKRLYRYHGAEHKTIACYEAGEELCVANVRKYTRFHPRCGTSFLILVVIVSVFLYSVLPWSNTGLRVLLKLLLLPLVMGISYELLKWCGRSDNWATRIIRQPGLWVQRLTVFEPDDSMIEVAIAAVTPVLPENPEDGRW